ncbi:MAG TPA: two-component regulator propeller domain-containing protein [Bryobacteraceae bacterium]|nr:two-component regulator propeller domain-containing protein [Bryobacteraceae bacterium]
MKYLSVQSARQRFSMVSYACAAFLLVCLRAQALDPSHSITQYSHASWTRQADRLPGGVWSLAQTKDGVLWIGTELGLLRFDGVRFQPWRPSGSTQIPGDSITALRAVSDGSLWIGTRAGLSHLVKGELHNYTTPGNSPGSSVRAILERRDRSIWLALMGYHSGGLCHVETNNIDCSYTSRLRDPAVSALFEDRDGSLWAGGMSALHRMKQDTIQVYSLPGKAATVASIGEDQRGRVWLTAQGPGSLLRLENGHLVACTILPASQPFQPSSLLADRDGGLWVGTLGQGLFHLHNGRVDRFNHTDGLSNDVVNALFEDHEGNIWAATESGLDRFREFAVTMLSKREGLVQDLVSSVLASGSGGVWIGTVGGVNRVLGNSISLYDRRQGLPSPSASGLFEDQAGDLWVATGKGLSYQEHARFHSMSRAVPSIRSITAAFEDYNRDIWFSDPEQGLVRIRDRRFVEALPWSQFRNRQARAIETGEQAGELWLGFSPEGLASWKPGRAARWYGPEDGLAPGAVVDLHRDRGGILWIATQKGLSRLSHDHLATLDKTNGLPSEHIQAMLQDDDGSIWLNTTSGLVRISSQELAAWSADPRRKIRPVVYDASDGMQIHAGSLGYFRHAARSTDGRLWFAAEEGVAVVDPKHLPRNRLAPPVAIEKVTAGGQDYPVNSPPRLPPSTKDLEIDYTAFSFVAPEKVQFRYMLEGLESEFHDAGNRRQAIYTNLPPKNYRFRVMASNNDGVWNETPASLSFIVLPAFYQTAWFTTLCAAALMLFLWGLYRFRLRQIQARIKLRFEERLAERTRIANELHDDLLQNISGFGLQLDGLSKIAFDSARVKERIRDLREQTEQWLHETRETVWDIRSPSLDDRHFLKALRETAERIAKGKPVHLQISITGNTRPLPPNLAGQLLRITREAIRNAIAHSHAHVIQLQVAYVDPNMLRIMVSDDGCGFDLEQGSRKMKHWGLAAMEERGRQIGAELNIDTAPGEGTRVEIRVRTDPGPE